MLPKPLYELASKLQYFPGVGVRSSQKLALDFLELEPDKYAELIESLSSVRSQIQFCNECGFFADQSNPSGLCDICTNPQRNNHQLCLVEKPTDVLTIEKSEIFKGKYHVLENLISPLDNIFAEHTTLSKLTTERLPKLLKEKGSKLEIILFFKAGFSSEATTAYLRELLQEQKLSDKITVTRLAQGLPMYYNPDTLDQATMVRALEDRRVI
jgi:recombination protein RecR